LSYELTQQAPCIELKYLYIKGQAFMIRHKQNQTDYMRVMFDYIQPQQ